MDTMRRLTRIVALLGLGCVGAILVLLSTHGCESLRIMRGSDEFEHFKFLHRMYAGMLHLDPVLFFSSPGFVYGFGYFILSFLVTLPFLATHNTLMIVLMPRLLSVFFAVLLLVVFYRILRIKHPPFFAFLATSTVVTLPKFWVFGVWNHPDAMMFFFLMLSFYFLLKQKALGSSAMLAVSISTKLQAIFYYPVIFLYFFKKEVSQREFGHFKTHVRNWIGSVCLMGVIGVVISPYLLHPMGRLGFIHQVQNTLRENDTLSVCHSALEKLVRLSPDLFPAFLWAVIFPVVVYQAFLFFRKNDSITSLLSVTWVLNMIYLLFFVARLNAIYYFSSVLVAFLIVFFVLARFRHQKWPYFLLGAFILLQLGCHASEYRELFQVQAESAENQQINHFVVASLKGQVSSKTHLLISLNLGFDYEALGLDINNTLTIRGPLTQDMFQRQAFEEKWHLVNQHRHVKRFFEKEFIVIKRKDRAISTAQLQQLYSGEWGYFLWKEGPDILIFKKVL